MERTIAGRYALRSLLGAGGMGEVHAALDQRLDRDVAVKLVPAAGIDPRARARFVREARAAARISHPNAVAVYDAGESDGFLYIVMERVDGPTLAARLAESRPMPVPEAASVAVAVLSALGAAHTAGVVHRDVKPSNVIVGPAGVKLVDFGIATLVGEASGAVTVAGELVGTPKYIAPEQIAGLQATPQTDLYAVGVMLFEMVTGVAPFDRSSPVATALAHRDEVPPDVRSIRPDTPPRVAAAIGTALQKRPVDRYRSAAEMARALDHPASSVDAGGDTAVMTAMPPDVAGGRAGGRGWWLAAAAVIVAGGGALVALLGGGDEQGTVTTTVVTTPSTVATTNPAGTTAAPTTLAPTTTAAAMAAATAPAPAPAPAADVADPPAPTSVDELISVLAADPTRYGPRTGEVVDRLTEIDNRGQRSRTRAAELLGSVHQWADGGELSAEAFALLEPVLAPLVEDRGNNDEEEDDDDD